MNGTRQYAIGTEVRCTDGECGRLNRVVIDPVARTLTHLVVDPGDGDMRLVPLDRVGDTARTAGHGDGKAIELRCTVAEFAGFEPAQETEFISGDAEGLGYAPGQAFAWPFFGLGLGTVGTSVPDLVAAASEPRAVTYDRVPSGEVQIRRGARVEAADGEIGRVQGLVVDPVDHGVTHVLLQEGHLWGKKTIAIPIRAVTDVGGNVKVAMSKAELGELPAVDLDEDHR